MPDKKTIARIADEGAAKYKDEAFEELVKLASIDSGHGDPVGSANMVNALEEIMMKDLKGLKFEKIVKEGFGTHILATLNEGNPNGRIIISGHTDTVFKQGDCAKFPVHIDEKDPDIAWGLGITDCKGGLVVAVKAVKVAMENGLLPDKEICFAFECDEEGGGGGGNELLHSRVIPEDPSKTLCFVFESSRDEDGVLIARKGSCGITIDVEGIRSHSGINYKAGRSAMFELAFQLMELLKYNDDERGIQFNVGRVVNDDPANVVSGHATAAISVRIANSLIRVFDPDRQRKPRGGKRMLCSDRGHQTEEKQFCFLMLQNNLRFFLRVRYRRNPIFYLDPEGFSPRPSFHPHRQTAVEQGNAARFQLQKSGDDLSKREQRKVLVRTHRIRAAEFVSRLDHPGFVLREDKIQTAVFRRKAAQHVREIRFVRQSQFPQRTDEISGEAVPIQNDIQPFPPGRGDFEKLSGRPLHVQGPFVVQSFDRLQPRTARIGHRLEAEFFHRRVPEAVAHTVGVEMEADIRASAFIGEILIPLPSAAEIRQIRAVRDHIPNRPVHQEFHVPSRSVIGMYRHIPDAESRQRLVQH
ncbi:MAG: M20/M25/M40 family metallo-hydrolase, partial [Firmicutes bacterium]|nr:M20/M25/M40 family metallo-hydrolase [Bacillota bacterium]